MNVVTAHMDRHGGNIWRKFNLKNILLNNYSFNISVTIKIQFFLFNHRNLTKLILHRVH